MMFGMLLIPFGTIIVVFHFLISNVLSTNSQRILCFLRYFSFIESTTIENTNSNSDKYHEEKTSKVKNDLNIIDHSNWTPVEIYLWIILAWYWVYQELCSLDALSILMNRQQQQTQNQNQVSIDTNNGFFKDSIFLSNSTDVHRTWRTHLHTGVASLITGVHATYRFMVLLRTRQQELKHQRQQQQQQALQQYSETKSSNSELFVDSNETITTLPVTKTKSSCNIGIVPWRNQQHSTIPLCPKSSDLLNGGDPSGMFMSIVLLPTFLGSLLRSSMFITSSTLISSSSLLFSSSFHWYPPVLSILLLGFWSMNGRCNDSNGRNVSTIEGNEDNIQYNSNNRNEVINVCNDRGYSNSKHNNTFSKPAVSCTLATTTIIDPVATFLSLPSIVSLRSTLLSVTSSWNRWEFYAIYSAITSLVLFHWNCFTCVSIGVVIYLTSLLLTFTSLIRRSVTQGEWIVVVCCFTIVCTERMFSNLIYNKNSNILDLAVNTNATTETLYASVAFSGLVGCCIGSAIVHHLNNQRTKRWTRMNETTHSDINTDDKIFDYCNMKNNISSFRSIFLFYKLVIIAVIALSTIELYLSVIVQKDIRQEHLQWQQLLMPRCLVWLWHDFLLQPEQPSMKRLLQLFDAFGSFCAVGRQQPGWWFEMRYLLLCGTSKVVTYEQLTTRTEQYQQLQQFPSGPPPRYFWLIYWVIILIPAFLFAPTTTSSVAPKSSSNGESCNSCSNINTFNEQQTTYTNKSAHHNNITNDSESRLERKKELRKDYDDNHYHSVITKSRRTSKTFSIAFNNDLKYQNSKQRRKQKQREWNVSHKADKEESSVLNASLLPKKAKVASLSSGSLQSHVRHQNFVVTARKWFHGVAVVLFVPTTLLAPQLQSLAYAIAIALLIAIESIRCDIPLIQNFYNQYLYYNEVNNNNVSIRGIILSDNYNGAKDDNADEHKKEDTNKDQAVILSHIGLIVGCAMPLWLAQWYRHYILPLASPKQSSALTSFLSKDNVTVVCNATKTKHFDTFVNSTDCYTILLESQLLFLSLWGIICVGVGDAMGAIVGSSIGRHKMFSFNNRTLEGSYLGMFLSMFICCYLLTHIVASYHNDTQYSNNDIDNTIKPTVEKWLRHELWLFWFPAIDFVTVMEASTFQNDNFLLPIAGSVVLLMRLGQIR